MKRILLLLVLCLNISMVLGQEYKNWEKYDIEGFYIIAKSKAEANIQKLLSCFTNAASIALNASRDTLCSIHAITTSG